MNRATTVHLNDVSPVEMMAGVWRRTLATGDRQMISHVTLEKGSTVLAHSHPHEQVGYVIEGQIDMTIEDQVHHLGAGDSYFIPGGVQHEARAVTDCIVLDIFSPPRDEYR